MQKTLKATLLTISLFLLPTTEAVENVKSVKIKVAGGVHLSAQYYAGDKPGPAVMLLSMCDPSTDQSEWVTLAKIMQSEGISVLTFDYRGFGTSEGKMPTNLSTVAQAMVYWRKNWSADVEAAYDVLISQKGVDKSRIGIGGASCGVFNGMDLTFKHANVKSFVSLGGPVDEKQNRQLTQKDDLPILIISGNEGPSLQWSDEIFAASNHHQTEIHKYKIVTHGTNIFDHFPKLQNKVAQWFKKTL